MMTDCENCRGLSQKSLTILLALGLVGGAAAAQSGRQACQSVHAMMAQTTPAGRVQPGRYQFGQQSRSQRAARNRRCLFAEDHRRQALQDEDGSGKQEGYSAGDLHQDSRQDHRYSTEEVRLRSDTKRGSPVTGASLFVDLPFS